MDRATLKQLLQEAESLLHRGEQNIAYQRETIGTLERGGHDATASKMFLKRLESAQARHIADRNRLIRPRFSKMRYSLALREGTV
jgi:hypothetical protein